MSLVQGVGVNDADYVINPTVDGKVVRCPFHRRWEKIMVRCYSDRYHEKYPTYKDCTVCDEWKSFVAFKAWMEQQDWEGKDLDKDIIQPGNKVYSPEMCAFVSRKVNLLLGVMPARDLPVGVYLSEAGRYEAVCQAGGVVCLGTYDDKHDAARAYAKAKARKIISAALIQPDRRVFLGLIKHAKLTLEQAS